MRLDPKKTAISLIALVLFATALYWLWQRQPKPQSPASIIEKITSRDETSQKNEKLAIKNPNDGSITTSTKLTVNGTTSKETYVVLTATADQVVTKTDSSGNFQKEIALADGLNFIKIDVLDKNSQEKITKTLTVFQTKKPQGSIVFAGSVKTIFGSVITLTTLTSDKTLRTSGDTQVDLPTQDKDEEKEATRSVVANVRVGDFAIALGDSSDSTTLNVKRLLVIRDNKPQLTKSVAQVQILSPVKNNSFTAKSDDNKILELTFDKNSDITLGDKDGKVADITKDKGAIIIFHEDTNKKIIDLVYLFP